LIFISPIYTHNWRNISTINIYNETTIKRNILTIKKMHRKVGRAKDLSAPLDKTEVHNLRIKFKMGMKMRINGK